MTVFCRRAEAALAARRTARGVGDASLKSSIIDPVMWYRRFTLWADRCLKLARRPRRADIARPI